MVGMPYFLQVIGKYLVKGIEALPDGFLQFILILGFSLVMGIYLASV
jgi:hypothetical protein